MWVIQRTDTGAFFNGFRASPSRNVAPDWQRCESELDVPRAMLFFDRSTLDVALQDLHKSCTPETFAKIVAHRTVFQS